MTHKAKQIHSQVSGSVETHSFGFIFDLDDDELLVGVPTITEVSTSNLTITNKQASTKELKILGRTHAIGKALQCSVTSSVIGTYEILWTCYTDSVLPRFLKGVTTITIEAE